MYQGIKMNAILIAGIIAINMLPGCSNTRQHIHVPPVFYKDVVVLDTTFLFEISENFNTKGDILYGSAVAIIKPAARLTRSNYLGYKTAGINFIYSSRDRIDYNVRKQQLNITGSTDSILAKVLKQNGRWISLDTEGNYKLYEVTLKARCFFIGVGGGGLILNPSSGRPKSSDNIVYYGISEIL